MTPLVFSVPDTVFSRALIDGAVTVPDFPVLFDPSGHSGPAASARLRGRIGLELAGAEQVIPDYLVRLARGVGQPLAAMPVFLIRGMVQRKYVGRRDGPPLEALNGRRIGVSRVLAATAVYLRGLLAMEHGLQRERVEWVAAEPFTSDDALATDWPLIRQRLQVPAPELLALLADGRLDAVLYPGGGGGNWYQWVDPRSSQTSGSHYGDLESLVHERPALAFPLGDSEIMLDGFRRTGVYPLFHMMAMHREVAERHPGLAAALTQAFSEAARRAPDYLAPADRRLYEREIELLGVDPSSPGLSPLVVRTVEALLDMLDADGVLPRRPSLAEVFPSAPLLA